MAVKLGEALARRAEPHTRLGQVRDRLCVCALVQEGDQPAEEPQPLLAELEAIAGDRGMACAACCSSDRQLRTSTAGSRQQRRHLLKRAHGLDARGGERVPV